jgi:hypothetical protein
MLKGDWIMLKPLRPLSVVVPLPWLRCVVALAATTLAFASYAAPIEIISAERSVSLVMWDSIYIDEEPYRVQTQLGPFAVSTIEAGSFDSSFVGVIQTDQVDYQRTLLGEARQTSRISGNELFYSGFVSGNYEPGIVTPDFYSDLKLLTLLGYHCCGVVGGESSLEVLFDVSSTVDFLFNFALATSGDPDNGPRFTLLNLDTRDTVFWGQDGLFFVEGEYAGGNEGYGELNGELEPGSYAFTATIWSSWADHSREAPGGSMELDLSFANPIPEPRSAILFGVGAIVIGVATKRKPLTLHLQ